MTDPKENEEARYLYCLGNGDEKIDFGEVGIEGSRIYTIPFNGIAAVVHRCKTQPYKTEDKEKAAEWVLAHQYVIDLATKEFATVVPLTFDTIFKGDDETVRGWLRENHSELEPLLKKLEGKAEYGVQIFVENNLFNEEIEGKPEIQRLKKEIEKKAKGVAYLLGKNLEKMIRYERNRVEGESAKSISDQIKTLVEDMRIESTKKELPEKWRGKHMILNLSCLAPRDDVQRLGDLLGEINNREGFDVRFTGPWPPYSFVGEIGSREKRVFE